MLRDRLVATERKRILSNNSLFLGNKFVKPTYTPCASTLCEVLFVPKPTSLDYLAHSAIMADAARNAARDEKAAVFKAKLEQERLAEEQRIAEAEVERQANIEMQARMKLEKEKQDARDAQAQALAAAAQIQAQKDEALRVAAEKEVTQKAEEV